MSKKDIADLIDSGFGEHVYEWHDTEDESDQYEQHILYSPPWRERLTNGRLGPTYGPKNASAYANAVHEWRKSIHGGGLWDKGEYHESRGVHRRERFRFDHDLLEWYMRRHSGDVGIRQLEVWAMYWRRMMSPTAIARSLGIARGTVLAHVGQLRQRIHKHLRTNVISEHRVDG